jgi:RNA polymerase sigma-70 factor (ECF subfamily)
VSSDPSNGDLIRQAVAGDRAALSQLLLEHYDKLYRHLERSIARDLQAVIRPEDVLQQVFIRAAQSVSHFEHRHPGSFAAWLETIATNLVRDAQRRRHRERRAGDLPENADSSGLALLVDRLVSDSTTPGGRVQRDEHVCCLQAAIATLPDEQREVIQRYYLQEQSYEQIAQELGRSKDSIRGLCYRARQNLRDSMGRSSLYFSR